jgi:hypothetical protein
LPHDPWKLIVPTDSPHREHRSLCLALAASLDDALDASLDDAFAIGLDRHLPVRRAHRRPGPSPSCTAHDNTVVRVLGQRPRHIPGCAVAASLDGALAAFLDVRPPIRRPGLWPSCMAPSLSA